MKMAKTINLLACLFLECFSSPTLSKEILRAKHLDEVAGVPVAYLAGDDCNTCPLSLNNSVGMLRFDTAQYCFGQPTPFRIDEHSAATLDSIGYVISGFGEEIGKPVTERNYLKTMFAYDPTNNTYTRVADLQIGRQQSSAVTVANKIYVVGGLTKLNGDGNTTEIFDGMTWTFGEQTLTPRYGHVVVNAGNYIWQVGGLLSVAPYTYLTSTEFINLDSLSDGWQQGPLTNNARGFAGAVVINNAIYLCGGWDSTARFANCEKLILNSDGGPAANQNWSVSTSAMSQPREDFTLVAYNNKAYTIGGYWPDIRSDYAATTVEEYDPVTDTWSVFYQAPSKGPFPNNCLGCRATILYVSESDMTC